MSRVISRAALLLQLGYGLYLVGVGVAGILLPRWELQQVFGLPVDSWPPSVEATFLNQYRFLKGIELGAGFFCIALWRQIRAGGTPGLVFIVIVGSGIVARVVATLADGLPHPAFLIFAGLEVLVLGTFLLHRMEARRAT